MMQKQPVGSTQSDGLNEIWQTAVVFNYHNEHVLIIQPLSDPKDLKNALNIWMLNFTLLCLKVWKVEQKQVPFF